MNREGLFEINTRAWLYRLSQDEEYGQRIWGLFQVAYKQRHGVSLVKSDEPHAVPPDALIKMVIAAVRSFRTAARPSRTRQPK